MTGTSSRTCSIHAGFKIFYLYLKNAACHHLLPVNIYFRPSYFKRQHHLDKMHFINNNRFMTLYGKSGRQNFSYKFPSVKSRYSFTAELMWKKKNTKKPQNYSLLICTHVQIRAFDLTGIIQARVDAM